jgi:hypothetical protein
LHEEPINPWIGYKRQGLSTTGLLRVNRTVHLEASSIFYGQNRFDFTSVTPDDVTSFLEQIGSINAGHIRHVIIEFPRFLYIDPGDITLEDDSVGILENVQRGCANLSLLTTSLYSTNSMELRLDNLDNHNLATEALKLIDTRFRDLPSIQDIIVEVFEDGPNDHIRRTMERNGWTISTTENAEEEEDWGRSFSDLDEFDYDYEYDTDRGDDYDIDNDSDFWRRAAD